MPQPHSEPPIHYIQRVRARTVYQKGRKTLNLLFGFSVLAMLLFTGTVALMGFFTALKTGSIAAMVPALGALVLIVVYFLGLALLRALVEAGFDAVDVLIEANRKKKPPEEQSAQEASLGQPD